MVGSAPCVGCPVLADGVGVDQDGDDAAVPGDRYLLAGLDTFELGGKRPARRAGANRPHKKRTSPLFRRSESERPSVSAGRSPPVASLVESSFELA